MKRAKQVTRAARSSSRFDGFWSRCGFAFTIPTTPMAIVLDHMIVPTRDKEDSARFFARIFGVPYEGAAGNFAPVRVNEQLTLDFDNRDKFERHHYAFKVSEAEFDGIFERVRDAGLRYGSGPFSAEDMTINHRHGGRGFYFRDPNGHLLEVLTA